MYEYIIAVGEVDLRRRIYERYAAVGAMFCTLIDPSASVSESAYVGEGCIIFPNVYVAHRAHIGKNSILHANSVIENYCVVGKHCFVSLCAFVGAGTEIGDVSFIGPNATLRDKIQIGEYAIIGMGSVVTHSISDYDVFVGNPAKFLRKNKTLRIGLRGNHNIYGR